MTLKRFPGGVWMPMPLHGDSGTNLGAMLLDAAGEQGASVFSFPLDGDVDKVAYGLQAVTTGATLDVRLETLSATTGDPSGTLFGTNTNAADVVPSTADNTVREVTLTAAATVNKGDKAALTVVNPAVSPGNLEIARWNGTNAIGTWSPWTDHFTTVWTKSIIRPVVAVHYVGLGWYPVKGAMVAHALPSRSFNSGSNPDEIALRFMFEFPTLISGAYVNVSPLADYEVVLYEGTTPLSTATHDGDQDPAPSANRLHPIDFPDEISLDADTEYRIALKPTTVTNITTIYFDTLAGLMGAMPGGEEWYWSERVNAGAWSNTTNRRPFIGLIVEGFDDGASGGGLAMVARGMRRGG